MRYDEVTVRQALMAMKKNGWTKAKRGYVRYRLGKPIAACAVGQAGLNLNVDSFSSLQSGIDLWVILPKSFRYNNETYSSVAQLNDLTDLTIPEIADLLFARAEELGNLDKVIHVF